MNNKYFLIVVTQKLMTKRLKFYDQLQLFTEVAFLIKSIVYVLRSSLFCYVFPSKLRIVPYSFLCAQCHNDFIC